MFSTANGFVSLSSTLVLNVQAPTSEGAGRLVLEDPEADAQDAQAAARELRGRSGLVLGKPRRDLLMLHKFLLCAI